MAGNCSREYCYPEENGCNYEGCDKLTDCKYYKTDKKEEVAVSSDPGGGDSELYVRMPWTGSAMGFQDLQFLAVTAPTTLIGVAGVASAGKTTFLATLYCLLRHGHAIGDYQFCGSLTLNGWENIAWYLSWKQNNNIRFPPHTSSNAGRVPGLLHMSLRNQSGERKELIFTDAPGEWFDAWSTNEADPNAQGAAWIHSQADAFLLFADCEMLAGAQLGKARKQTRQVSDRLKHGLGDRPLGLVWSKSDIQLDSEIKQQISKYIQNSSLCYYHEFEASVREGDEGQFHNNVLECVSWLLSSLNKRINTLPLAAQQAPGDMFLSKR